MSISPTTTAISNPQQDARAAEREVKVWDVPTRAFHWLMVVLVALAWATGEEEGVWFAIHALAGYAVLAALLFRIVWGFAGGAYARFSSFLQPASVTASYVKQLIRLRPPRFVGHNPLGAWMIIALLLVLALMVVSGLFAEGEEGLAGPWASSAIGVSARQWYEIHEVLFNVLLGLIAIHVAGVVIDQLLTRDKLVKAMFTGRKRVPDQAQILEGATVSATRVVTVLIAALIVTGFLVGWQLPSTTASDGKSMGEQDKRHERNER
ncbi:MAG TPA: cytochrome b/b6 domain-containing protein [Burkholderiales bacterium]|nr:cytochrome b/b6 domain-containing protein [Burkholderiales bacterium]